MLKMILMVCLVLSAVDCRKKGKQQRLEAMEEYDCCPAKKIWGSPTPNLDGVYILVEALDLTSLPKRCNSPCVYQKRGDVEEKMFCFADSMVSQSECTFDGEEPVFIGDGVGGSGSDDGMGGSGPNV